MGLFLGKGLVTILAAHYAALPVAVFCAASRTDPLYEGICRDVQRDYALVQIDLQILQIAFADEHFDLWKSFFRGEHGLKLVEGQAFFG